MPSYHHPQHRELGSDSHELGAVPAYRHPNPTHSYPLSSRDHNAFGDDSDSEDHDHRPLQDQDQDHQPDEFDVYKDFNNQGIRYTTLLNGLDHHPKPDHPDDHHHPASPSSQPILQPEKYPQADLVDPSIDRDLDSPSNLSLQPPTQDKLLHHSKPHSKNSFSVWKSGPNRWRIGSIVAFISLSCIGVAVFFIVPRQPFISFEIPVTFDRETDNHLVFSVRNPTNFSFDAQLQMGLDGRNSYLPTLIRDFQVIVNDLGSTPNSVLVGTGNIKHGFTCSSRDLTTISTNVQFLYNAKDPSDELWQEWRKGCGNIAQSTINGTITRPSLQLYITISFKVIGLIGTKYDSIQLNNVGCPAELPANAPSF